MNKNEIFYSLSKYEINAIQNKILNSKNNYYLDIVIPFNQQEFNSVYKLLSNLYSIDNKDYIETCIWETFICNKIIKELEKYEIIYYPHNLQNECKILNSYNLSKFIENIDNRSKLSTLSNIIENQISKKVIIHYFQNETIIPINLQKIINQILVSKLPFTNILYTTRNSLNSYFMHTGYWNKLENTNIEIWKLLSNREEKANF